MAASPLFIHRFQALGSDNELQLHAADAVEAARLFALATAEAARIEAKYTRYRDDSLTSAINRAAGGAPVPIDAETAALLDYADACHRQSDGMFDLTSGVLRRVWDFRRGIVPSADAVAALLPLIGWDKVERAAAGNAAGALPTVRLARPGMELDFGGIGKEYCADRVAAVLLAAGVTSGLVNLGGDVRVLGPHPDGASWSVAIRHPRVAHALLAAIKLTGGALATSGDYERYFEVDGRRYCHMLDPRTGYPVPTMQSVTVVAPLCTVAGTVCTVAMLKGAAGPQFLREQSCPYLAVDAGGAIHGALAD
jgi:FAD:protein FMN transferase